MEELNSLCLIIMTFHKKVVSIFNMAAETERRFIDSILIEIIVLRLKLIIELQFRTSRGKVFHSLMVEDRK